MKNSLILDINEQIKIKIIIYKFQKKLKNEIDDNKIIKKKGFIIS